MRPSPDQEPLGGLKLSLPLITTREWEGSSMMSRPYAGKDTWIRFAHPTQPSRSPRSRLQNLSLRIFLATTISVAAVLLPLSICNSLRSREQGSGVARRRLAEGGRGIDEEELSIVDACLALEEEMGLLQERADSSSQGNSANRVAELMSMLSDAGAAEGPLREHLPVEGQSQEQFQKDRSVFESKSVEWVGVDSPSAGASVERPGSTGVSPALDPESWLDTIPSISSPPDLESWLDTIPSISSPPEEEEGDEGFGDSGEDVKTGDTPTEPALKRRRGGGIRDLLQCGDISNHPYVHLPVLEEGVVPRYIQPPFVLIRKSRKASISGYLLRLRRLFAQKTLSQVDLDILQDTVEELINMSWSYNQAPPNSIFPIRVVEALGTYFMVLDYVVCAIQLLGDYMQPGLWWEKFAASFKTNLPLPVPGSRHTELAEFHTQLARRLAAALVIYKRGMRPQLSEVVNLKRLLFCSPYGRHRFKDPKWDPWREDGEC